MLPTRYYSDKQEKSVAKDLDGKQVANSGATPWSKGDVRIGNKIAVECKTCTKEQKSFAIKKEWIDKIKLEAYENGKSYSCVAFNFGPDTENYYIIDTVLMQYLVDKLRADEEM
jgi:hypothetical protein